jgi:hypothetical protein
MKKVTPKVKATFMCLITAAIIFSGCKKDENRPIENPPVAGPDLIFYGLTASGQLVKYNAMAPGTVISTVTINGLQSGESVAAIDFRPATGELYGIGTSSRLYIINLATGAARMVGTDAFTPALNGDIAGFDFNPTVDRLRVVTNMGQNLRINPETGAVAVTDGAINGVNGAMVNAVAYTNSMAGAAATSLFDIDINTNKLYKQSPPNNGTLVEIGSLGVMATGEGGFDISPDNSAALATLWVDGKSSLFKIDTATGAASRIGDFTGTDAVKAIAIPTKPVAYAVDAMNNFLIFNPTSTAAPVSKAIVGLMAGETVKGIDFRPLNGQIYGLGSTGMLYTINAASGAASVVGVGPFAVLNGAYFGFDFNPTVDRIRVVSRNGQNLRLHPVTGLVAASDAVLNPGTPYIASAAYTNNFAGATTTTLYDIDCHSDSLFIQSPPNNGTLVPVGALGIDIQSENGFDIGSTSGSAYAIFSVGSTNGLYSINLTTGAATRLMDFPVKVNGFTIGLGF